MALTDYKIGPDNQIYYQGHPLPPEFQNDPRIRSVAQQNTPNYPKSVASPGSTQGRTGTVYGQQPPPAGTGTPSYPKNVGTPSAPASGGLPGYDPGQYQPAPGSGGSSIYPKGVANPGGAPGGGAPPAGGGALPPVDQGGAPAGPASGQPTPGTPAWDLYRINDMLESNGLRGWQVTSAVPAKDYAADQRDSIGEPLPDAVASYIINVRNPQTNAIKQVVMNRVWQDDKGGFSLQDPGDPGAGYGYQLSGVKDQPGADANKVGHSEMHIIGTELWGTNNATGAFEKVPNAPPIPKDVKGWTDLRQIEDAQGNMAWWGNDPKDGEFKQHPSLPSIPAAARGFGNPFQVKQADGSTVWMGIDPTTKQPVPIPNMPKTGPEPKGPGSITSGGRVFVQKADGSYEPAAGIPDPNPPKGTPRITLGSDGFLYQQISRGDGTYDPDPTWDPVPYTDAAKASRTATGAQHKAGEPGTKLIGGKEFPVIYRGGGDENFDVVPASQGGKASPYPGAIDPTAIATSNDQEFITQRMPDGSVQTIRNQNWKPTDPAERVRQLSALASDKFQELHSKIGATYTPEQANADMEKWWATNITPAQQQIQLDQQKQQIELQNKVVDQNRANMATAQTAGQNAVSAFTAMQSGRVGPGWEEANAAASRGDFAALAKVKDATGYQAEDPQITSQRAVMEALKNISPQAAAATGAPMPNFQALDPYAGLNRLNYSFGAPSAGAQLAPPPPPPPVPPAPPPGPPGIPVTQGIAQGGGIPQEHDWAAEFGQQLLPPGVAGTPADPRFRGMYGVPPYAFPG